MNIGVPKEIKNREHRVSLTPANVAELCLAGHRVVVQSNAGAGCGFEDSDYRHAGASITVAAAEAWGTELVVKVKEPLPQEYGFLRQGLVLFTYLHLASVPELADKLLETGVRAIGYETVQLEDGSLPLLAPMSHIAGRLAVQMGVHYLQAENGTSCQGSGLLPGGIDNVPPAHVLILGGGNAGSHAAMAAAGLGARVTVLDNRADHVKRLRPLLPATVDVELMRRDCLAPLLASADLLIGAALVPGEHAPELLSREMLATMRKGSVFVDIAIDQGGMSESSRPTSYDEPVYVDTGIIHCCLPNMPAAVPLTSTRALTAATLPYVRAIADLGVAGAIEHLPELGFGINTWDGELRHPGVAAALRELSGNS
ncbi:MAG TPA: alanine dehydrogenase [Mariprofundaceae bacterium]|nr:alanine dehydrogenase [Mariprofundaceae bacterium]